MTKKPVAQQGKTRNVLAEKAARKKAEEAKKDAEIAAAAKNVRRIERNVALHSVAKAVTAPGRAAMKYSPRKPK
jgi:hypothetical protein